MMVIIQDWLINPLSPLISKAFFFFFLWVICSVLDCPAQWWPVSLEKPKKPNPTSCQLSLHPSLCFISSALRPPSLWVIASVTSALIHFLLSTFGPFAAVGQSNVTAANATVNPGASSEKQLHLLATESRCCVTGRVSLRWRSASFLFSHLNLSFLSTPRLLSWRRLCRQTAWLTWRRPSRGPSKERTAKWFRSSRPWPLERPVGFQTDLKLLTAARSNTSGWSAHCIESDKRSRLGAVSVCLFLLLFSISGGYW